MTDTESTHVCIRFLQHEPLPRPGDELTVKGMAGYYRVKILRVLSQRPHPTDTSVVLVEVEATRQLLENTHEG